MPIFLNFQKNWKKNSNMKCYLQLYYYLLAMKKLAALANGPTLCTIVRRAGEGILIDWLWWGENMSQNCGRQRAHWSSPWWYVNMESHGDDNAA
jgi:hypothetical protein